MNETIFLRDETRRNASHLLLPGKNRIINMAGVKHVQTGAHLEKLAIGVHYTSFN
jgi:hypothetical protein